MIKRVIQTSLITFMLFFNALPIFAKTVIIGGETIGIHIKYESVIITGTYSVKKDGKVLNPEIDNDIKAGDMIVAINSNKIQSVDDVFQAISKEVSNGNKLSFGLVRNNESITREIEVIYDEKENLFKTGLLIKDKISGVGTITFYDPENNVYGALGHEISDNSATGISLNLNAGSIFTSSVITVTKSLKGNPGEKIAKFNEIDKIGNIQINSKYGIYGNYQSIIKDDKIVLETADIAEIMLGKAKILTVLEDNKIEEFEIEITSLKNQSSPSVKGIEFKVTDKKLLAKTNGIIQGMSGSPIIQNGKLIGAVTHVTVDNVDQGYGMYIDWMLEESKKIDE